MRVIAFLVAVAAIAAAAGTAEAAAKKNHTVGYRSEAGTFI